MGVLNLVTLTADNYKEHVHNRGQELPDLNTIKRHEFRADSNTILHQFGMITPAGNLIGFGMFVMGT